MNYCRKKTSAQPVKGTTFYSSDASMSHEEIILGLMEISALSLPEESHKYYSRQQNKTAI